MSRLAIMKEMSSPSPRGLSAAVSSSERGSIWPKYSVADREPFWAFVGTTRRLLAQDSDTAKNMVAKHYKKRHIRDILGRTKIFSVILMTLL